MSPRPHFGRKNIFQKWSKSNMDMYFHNGFICSEQLFIMVWGGLEARKGKIAKNPNSTAFLRRSQFQRYNYTEGLKCYSKNRPKIKKFHWRQNRFRFQRIFIQKL